MTLSVNGPIRCAKKGCAGTAVPGIQKCARCREKARIHAYESWRDPVRRAKRAARFAKWQKANPEKMRARTNRAHRKIRDQIRDHYGRKCACCGEERQAFLTLDHINNDGAKHRAELGNDFYRKIRRAGFPPGLQTLCWNCNMGKQMNGGVCPHAQEREQAIEEMIALDAVVPVHKP